MSDQVLVSTRKGLFTIDRRSGGWEITNATFLGDNVPIVMSDARDGTLYAAMDHGHFGSKIHRSTDGGRNWHECAVPEYPEQPAGQKDVCPMSGIDIPWKLKLIWALAPGGADQPGVLWCGTVPGGLFRSADGGESWKLCEALWHHPKRKEWFGGGLDYPGIHSVCVHPSDSNHVIAGVSCGGAWVTHNSGDSWELCADGMIAEYMPPERQKDPSIQDPHCLVQCRSQPDKLWVQHHNGVFRSTDGAATWQQVTDVVPSKFGFAVAVHPADGDTAWLVPAIKDEKRIPVDGSVVVTRTRDGGKSFDVLKEGLPQSYAYDLTFRHALDIDESGKRLAFGSTTGALWITENQGDNWQCISAHLPPVYCVRFVKTST